MSDTRSGGGEDRGSPPNGNPGYRAPEVVARLGGPVFVEVCPGRVSATCRGLTGVGPDRASAFRQLVERAGMAPT